MTDILDNKLNWYTIQICLSHGANPALWTTAIKTEALCSGPYAAEAYAEGLCDQFDEDTRIVIHPGRITETFTNTKYVDNRLHIPPSLDLNCSRKNPYLIPPENGWDSETWYLVDVSFGPSNPIHRCVFFSGFLNGKNDGPGGYNQCYSPDYSDDESHSIEDLVYLAVVKRLGSSEEWGM